MNPSVTPELYWTIYVALLTSLLWIPHIAQRIVEMKPYAALRDPKHEVHTQAAWAQRAIRAHTNAVENLVVFAVLAFAVHVTGTGTALTATAAALYFFARVAHYVIYVAGIPWLRTPAFLVGFACQLVLGLTVLGLL
jgi:uncharacterized MAPEG superfamily protein